MRKFVATAAVTGGAVLLAGCGGGDGPTEPAPPVTPKICGAEQDGKSGTPTGGKATVPDAATYDAALGSGGDAGLTTAEMATLRTEMATLLKNNNDCWPYDTKVESYAGLMARLTWHCSGSYRDSDGKGGCTGGRQRFVPENSWPDNANLEKARHLLVPMKEKWGDKLSWGDLMVLAGTVAYAEAGHDDLKMCYGRMDEADGEASKVLGPTASQEYFDLQDVDPNSSTSPGATTVGLIYVNPGGPRGGHEEPTDDDLVKSADEIRRTFTVMDHSDRGAVALIGGGHSIGKSHGACAEAEGGKGPIWEGTCGETGKGADTTTSGFEGYWTSPPNQFTNQFFKDLLGKTWVKHKQSGSQAWVWKPDGADQPDIFRLTTDMALLQDAEYKKIVEEFASDDGTLLKAAFKEAWFILTTRGDGTWSPNAKCDDGTPYTPPASRLRMRSDDVAFV